MDLQANSLAQAILVELFRRFDLDEHLRHARSVYARRAARLVEALRRYFPAWRFDEPRGGFSVLVETDEPGDDRALLALATAHGVAFDPGRLFRADERSSPMALRLCHSFAPETALAEAVQRLARAWEARRPRGDDGRGFHTAPSAKG